MSSGKCQPSCLGLIVLSHWCLIGYWHLEASVGVYRGNWDTGNSVTWQPTLSSTFDPNRLDVRLCSCCISACPYPVSFLEKNPEVMRMQRFLKMNIPSSCDDMVSAYDNLRAIAIHLVLIFQDYLNSFCICYQQWFGHIFCMKIHTQIEQLHVVCYRNFILNGCLPCIIDALQLNSCRWSEVSSNLSWYIGYP